jgi:hypothetical protein
MRSLLCLFVALMAGTPLPANDSIPQIRNELRRCVEVKAGHPRTEENLFLLPAHFTFSASVGACGCRSGGIRYRVYETYQGRPREMNFGTLNTIPRVGTQSDVLLVLNEDIMIERKAPFRVDFMCEQ